VDTEAEAARCIQVLTGLLQEMRPQIVPRANRDAGRPSRRRTSRAKARPARPGVRATAKTKTTKKKGRKNTR
jgi:hypothetical protein